MGQNIIELNGKTYDALTGNFLGNGGTPVTKRSSTPIGHRGRSIDGFVKTSKQSDTNTTQPMAFIPVKPTPKTLMQPTKQHSPAKHLPAHHPEHAKTLMRSVVKKPTTSQKPLIKMQAPAEVMAAPVSTIAPKLSVTQVDPQRLERAHEIKKNEAVKKFTPTQRNARAYANTVAPVRARSAATPIARSRAATPAVAAPATQSTTPAPKRDIFEEAIAHATSHEQPHHPAVAKKHRSHRRLVNVLASLAAILVIGGFVAYLNAPNIELRIASVQAGFHATLPSYKPVGYAMAHSVSAHNGQVAVSFKSDNGTNFKLTQQPSSWDSSTLYDNLIAATNASHQTINSNGRTIYLFNNTNAAWVNSGVLYQITGTAELSNSQISELATSM